MTRSGARLPRARPHRRARPPRGGRRNRVRPRARHLQRLFATATPCSRRDRRRVGPPAVKRPERPAVRGAEHVRGLQAARPRARLPGAELQRHGPDQFMTEPLWGVGSTGPYGHDGRSMTLRDVILRHGGEAQGARDSFAALRRTSSGCSPRCEPRAVPARRHRVQPEPRRSERPALPAARSREHRARPCCSTIRPMWSNRMMKSAVRSAIVALLFAARAAPQTPAGPEFRINTFTFGLQSLPASAAAANGDFVIAWNDVRRRRLLRHPGAPLRRPRRPEGRRVRRKHHYCGLPDRSRREHGRARQLRRLLGELRLRHGEGT